MLYSDSLSPFFGSFCITQRAKDLRVNNLNASAEAPARGASDGRQRPRVLPSLACRWRKRHVGVRHAVASVLNLVQRYLHLGFTAPRHLASHPRVCIVWAILRVRHPPLAARAEMHAYDDVRFVYVVHLSDLSEVMLMNR